jgi:short-subunit dehydrogenase
VAIDLSGKTALITGASSGIGAELAKEFGRRGTNLVLVARRKDRLDAVAVEIRAESSVNVAVVAQDLSTPNSAAELEAKLRSTRTQVDVLINNAGFGTHGRFVNEDRYRVRDEISLNVSALVDLTAAFLPGMIARDFGVVVNIASTASFQPVPGLAVYAATKAFVRSFTEAVWGEIETPNVRVFAVSPGPTESEFFDVSGGKPMGRVAPTVEVVNAIMRQIDARGSQPSVVVGGRNSAMAWMSARLPKKSVIRVAAKMFLPPSQNG